MIDIYNIVIECEIGGGDASQMTICSFATRELAVEYCREFNKKHKDAPVDEILGTEKIMIQKVSLYDAMIEAPERHLEVLP